MGGLGPKIIFSLVGFLSNPKSAINIGATNKMLDVEQITRLLREMESSEHIIQTF